METLLLDPQDVIIPDKMERYRKDLGDLKGLQKSIERTRQILPIVINRNKELIDGGRRLEVCKTLGIQVKVVYEDVVDKLEMRELELEANFHRKDYTPAERSFAIRDLHILMQSRYGHAQSGKTGGWTLEDTAKKVGVTKGSIIDQMQLAEIVDAFPQLKQVKKATQIRKAAKALKKLNFAVQGMKKYKKIIEADKELYELHKADAFDYMVEVENERVDILITDPLYGIEHHRIGIGAGGETGGESSTGYKFDDSVEPALRCYDFLAQESRRFTKNTAHGYIFLAIEHFNLIRNLFEKAGWRAYVKPIIWIKRETGQCNLPTHWPADCYEAILYIRQDASRLVKEGMPNWLDVPPLSPSKKIHQYEKPVPLLSNLLKRSALPGQTLFDPFMGSASSIEAGVRHKLFSIGVDNSQEAYAFATQRMAKVMKKLRKEA